MSAAKGEPMPVEVPRAWPECRECGGNGWIPVLAPKHSFASTVKAPCPQCAAHFAAVDEALLLGDNILADRLVFPMGAMPTKKEIERGDSQSKASSPMSVTRRKVARWGKWSPWWNRGDGREWRTRSMYDFMGRLIDRQGQYRYRRTKPPRTRKGER